jgi:diacylglycerol kinase (ATP)
LDSVQLGHGTNVPRLSEFLGPRGTISTGSSRGYVCVVPWTLVVNPTAGRGRGRRKVERRLNELDDAIAALQRRGVDILSERSTSFDDLVVRARGAAAAGRDLVAAGGDGTAGAVAGVAASAGRRFAMVPLGSGNDFARTLGYDLKRPLDALTLLTDDAGTDRMVDLGRADGHWYNCVTCSGFDAEVNRWANSVHRLSGTALYIVAVVRTLAIYRPRRFAITVDGQRHERRAWMVSVGNSTTYGGGMKIVPDARLDDGQLDVCVIGDVSKAKLLWHFPKVFSGTHARVEQIQFFRGATVTVEALEPGLHGATRELWADGERVAALPITVVAVPQALVVRVPR